MERHLADGGEEIHWPEEAVSSGCAYDPPEEVPVLEADLENLEVVDSKDSSGTCNTTRLLEVLAVGHL